MFNFVIDDFLAKFKVIDFFIEIELRFLVIEVDRFSKTSRLGITFLI